MALNWIFLNDIELLNCEWLSAAIGLGITYIVFIMGVPALVFQTFIPDYLRGIYNKRFPIDWGTFYFQMFIIIGLFVLGNPWLVDRIDHVSLCLASFIATLVLLSVICLLTKGWKYLKKKFDSTKDIETRLARLIVDTLIIKFNETGTLDPECVDDLRTMAQSLPAGKLKNDFLAECERAVEHLLAQISKHRDTKLVSEFLEKVVCTVITYDGTQFNHENILKALDILTLTYNQSIDIAPDGPIAGPYLHTTVGNCMKEIGIKAMIKKDLLAVLDVVEKLSTINATAREMFVLGDTALEHGYISTAVTAVKRLRSKVPTQWNAPDNWTEDDRRSVYFWLGLISKISLLKGSAGEYAQRQIKGAFKPYTNNHLVINELLQQAARYYYLQADFATIDALNKLKQAK